MTLPRKPLSVAVRTFLALALPLAIAACGGGGGGGGDPTPLPPAPPAPPGPPVVRGLTNFQRASVAIGQANLESGAPNQGSGASAQSFVGPTGLALTPDGALLVADPGNNRILFFPATPTASGQSATDVMGQASPQSTAPSNSQNGLNRPFGMAIGAGKLAVADRANHRVLIYNELPRQGAMPTPAVVIGQSDFGLSEAGCGGLALREPESVAITPLGKLIIADTGNNRVLIWDSIPQTQAAVGAPNVVLGQGDVDHCTPNDDLPQDGLEDFDPGSGRPLPSDQTLSGPADVWSNDDMLIVADRQNHRVLIWTSFPQENFESASRVLGHSTFTDGDQNSEQDGEESVIGPKAGTLSGPSGVHFDGISLAVADSGNHRVLVWKTFPLADFQSADIVLGHADFNRGITNDQDGDEATDTPTSQVFYGPARVLLTPDALFVSDRFHNRVLVFRR